MKKIMSDEVENDVEKSKVKFRNTKTANASFM